MSKNPNNEDTSTTKKTVLNHNMTVTVIAINCVFIIGHIPYAIAFIYSTLKNYKVSYNVVTFRVFCLVILFTSHSINIIVYYLSNKVFKNIIEKIAKDAWFKLKTCLKFKNNS